MFYNILNFQLRNLKGYENRGRHLADIWQTKQAGGNKLVQLLHDTYLEDWSRMMDLATHIEIHTLTEQKEKPHVRRK